MIKDKLEIFKDFVAFLRYRNFVWAFFCQTAAITTMYIPWLDLGFAEYVKLKSASNSKSLFTNRSMVEKGMREKKY